MSFWVINFTFKEKFQGERFRKKNRFSNSKYCLDHENKIIHPWCLCVTIKYKDKKHKGMLNIGSTQLLEKKLSIELNIFDFKEYI